MSRNRSGFTLVELMLSMSFISVMLMAIALCVIQISTIYSRGETVRQLNQAMRVVATDLENTTAISHPFDVSAAAINAGRLCMGSFTYVWSTPTRTNTVSGGSAIRFGRVSDPARSLCNAGSLSTTTISGDVIELMEAGDRTLMVHSFSITPVVAESAAGQRMYSITMLVGTNNTAAIETTADDVAVCRAPSDASADFTYCAINEFTITVRAGIR